VPDSALPAQAGWSRIHGGEATLRGVGIDIVDVEEIEAALGRFGERYLRRVYSSGERAAWGTRTSPRRLAACFAAKEATIKALDLDGAAVPLRCVEIRLRQADAVEVALTGVAAILAKRRGIDAIVGSVAVGRRCGTAVVFAIGHSG
jgi:holo-[acyl-carrier protein] synthase